MSESPERNAHVFLTGVTGFVGKVVLEELLFRRDELGIERVIVLARGSTGRDGRVTAPADRFRKVAKAEIFKRLPEGWESLVDVVAGDLERDRCGLSEADHAKVTARTTHVIHCAASVDFDLPVKDAAAANITSALQVLELARACPNLVGMTDVSTAYVTAWREGPIEEKLAHLPRSAEELYQAILDGSRSEEELKAETGHPNTYTYTKCIAEHLLTARRGEVPLNIVRPSIISAAWGGPVPGWIDSAAAFAGCLLYTGLGIVRAWVADPSVRLDVVPVDVVSNRIVEATFRGTWPRPGEPVPIRFAAMGIENAMRIDMAVQATTRYFLERPGARSVPGMFVGRMDQGFAREDLMRRTLPIQMMRAYLAVTNRHKDRRKLEQVDEKVRFMNSVFGYFTHHTFDFRPSVPGAPEGFSPPAYMEVFNRGLYRHLLRMDETEATLAGLAHNDARGDLEWAYEKPQGNWAIRTLGLALRKTLRRCTTKVTFDRPAFERAVEEAPPDALFVLAPSHRSYFDFLLTSYLCFQHPELGIPVPHIAAAAEFSRIPLVGGLLKQSQAFYIKRGVGKEVPEVSDELRRIAARKASLMFFVEGQRSRARRVLAPKRGLLRGLQATGRTFAVLPIAMSYDRVPEESAFERELKGGERSKMSLTAILKWLAHLARDEVQLGRVHISCGDPIVLDPSTDVHALAAEIVAQQQRQTATTRFHLRTFLDEVKLDGVDENWLVNAIRRSGGRVLESDLPVPRRASAALLQSLRNQWMHWFYADALALFPDSFIVRDHVERNGWTDVVADCDARAKAVVEALFEPVVADYALVGRSLGQQGKPLAYEGPCALVQAFPNAHLPHLEDAYQSLAERGILVETKPGSFAWGPNAADVEQWRAACTLEGSLPETDRPVLRAVGE